MLLVNLALLPPVSIPFDHLELLFAENAALDTQLLSLWQKGWIEYNAGQKSFRCNPIVQQTACNENRAQLAQYTAPLVDRLIALLAYEPVVRAPTGLAIEQVVSFMGYGASVAGALQTDGQYRVGVLCDRIGSLYLGLGNLDQALGYFEDFLRLMNELYASNPTNVEIKYGLAISYCKLGDTHETLGNLDQALGYFEDDLRLTKELYASNPTKVEFKYGLAASYDRLGNTHTTLGNLEQALGYFEEETELFKELYASNPTNVGIKNGLAISYWQLGNFYCEHKKDKEKAREYFFDAKAHWEMLATQFPMYVAFTQNFKRVKSDIEQLDK